MKTANYFLLIITLRFFCSIAYLQRLPCSVKAVSLHHHHRPTMADFPTISWVCSWWWLPSVERHWTPSSLPWSAVLSYEAVLLLLATIGSPSPFRFSHRTSPLSGLWWPRFALWYASTLWCPAETGPIELSNREPKLASLGSQFLSCFFLVSLSAPCFLILLKGSHMFSFLISLRLHIVKIKSQMHH